MEALYRQRVEHNSSLFFNVNYYLDCAYMIKMKNFWTRYTLEQLLPNKVKISKQCIDALQK